MAEAYRKIATNIEFANIDNNIKTIMVTSCMPGEGKTTTVCNIASVMIDMNKKVLILDMDFRKPSVHKQLKLSNKEGLTDLLMKKDDFKLYVNQVYEGLDVITCGKIPSNPSKIINSNAVLDLIKQLSTVYDYIFIDAPPVALVSDPITIAAFADATIIAVAHSETDTDAIKKTVDSLKRVNANIIGTVLNKLPISKSNKYYYNYY